ncbi:hypothetical protein [Streptomyces sp. NPDC049881]|uniref:hypothetical protein n=1 Tax=Streptomyces sp. NPDC049881 TaxID=3155778 RepID=UPI00342D38EB
MGHSSFDVMKLWLPVSTVGVVAVLLSRSGRQGRSPWRPSSMAVLGCVSFFNAVALWFVATAAGGLDLEESCEWGHGVRFDDEWNSAHYRESGRLFPVHARCSADVDLVPSWVNPVIVVLVSFSLACLCAAVCLGVRAAARRMWRPRPDGAAATRSV